MHRRHASADLHAPGVASAAIECEAAPTRPRPLHVVVPLGGTDLGRSGIGTYVRELLPVLAGQLGAEGGRLTVFGSASDMAAFEPALRGATRRVVPGLPSRPGLNALWHLGRAGAFARRLGADVLLLPAANRRITLAQPLPTVAVVHDLAQLSVDRKYSWLRMVYFQRVLVPAFQRPQRLVAVSGATRDDLVHKLGISAERIVVVHNGVDTRRFPSIAPDSDAVITARAAVGLGGRPYLLYPARLEHPGKNHVRLFEAFARSGLAATHTLALSGADWGAGALLHDRARALRIESAVRFLDFVPSELIGPLVSGADAVIMVGLHEGFGLPALEALSAGRPVVVANTGALPEVVGTLGASCDPFNVDAIASALRKALTDSSLRVRCSAEGPSWAERFSWTRTARGLLDACHDVVG